MPEPSSQEKKRNSQMVAIIIAVIVAAAVLFGGGAFLFTKLFSGHVRSADEYEKTTLTPASYTTTVSCDGEIRAAKSSSVSPEVDGTVSSVKVEEGDKVTKGTVLMTIKNSSVTKTAKSTKDAYEKAAAVEQRAYASYQSALASVTSAQKRKNSALKQAEKRAKKLQEEQEAANAADGAEDAGTTEQETTVTVDSSYDDAITSAQNTADSAKASYEAAKSNADNAKSAYDAAHEQEMLLTVRAGESGTVVNLKAEKGMTTGNLNAKGAAMQIADLDTLVAVVKVPESSVSSVSRGQEATVTSTSLPNRKIQATVSKIASTPNDSENGNGEKTYNATLTIGSDKKAKVGMGVTAEIELQDFGTVYYVPQTAIQDKDGLTYATVIYDDGTTEQHQVVVVGTADDGSQVIKADSLAQGTTILSDVTD